MLSFASSVVKPACHVVREFWTGWWIILVILLAKNPWDLTELKHVLSIFLPGLQLFAYFDLFLFVCVCFDFYFFPLAQEPPGYKTGLPQTQSVPYGCLQPVMFSPGWRARQCPCIALMAGLCLAGISQMKTHPLSFILNSRDLVWFFPFKRRFEQTLNVPKL